MRDVPLSCVVVLVLQGVLPAGAAVLCGAVCWHVVPAACAGDSTDTKCHDTGTTQKRAACGGG